MSTPSRNRLRRALPAVVLAALVSSGCAIQPNDNTLPGQVAVGEDGYTVEVHFDQIENLVPNSTVLKDNVVIGTVAKIEVQDWEAVVEMRLLKSVELPANVVFAVGQKTLLGAQYVDVSIPGAADGALQDGDVIGVEQTGTYPATEQVLGAVALLLNNGGLSQISTITGELSTALRDRVPDTKGLIRRANDLLAVLDANRGQIVSALESLDQLTAGLKDDRSAIATAIDEISPGLQALEEERARLVKAVTTTGRTGDRAVRVIRASETALLANLDSLGPILANLGKASETLPEALKLGLTIPFPVMTTGNAIKGDYANLFATLDLRSGSLVDSWLGGMPPALQAGDPVQDPLAPPAADTTDQPADTPADTPADGDKAGVPAPPAPAPAPAPAPKPGCLLRLLGLC
ncbi:MCE family protein [Nocardioides sp. WS12]|uniref:MCE family protein n=1 Tax=Nocardioides sp. WS12 TaxID=2486272 RepID=UPI0015F9BE11|nr:MCE family protein [Nocardioides sp. WS12]